MVSPRLAAMAQAPRYQVDGKPSTRDKAETAWIARDPDSRGFEQSREVFNQAHEQSTAGYCAREWIEQEGITLRHANEERT